MPGLWLGHALHVQAGQRRGFAAALLLERFVLVLGLIELSAQMGNAAWLKANPRALLLIEGSSDERGTNEYNLALSERRARVAMNYLVGQGIQASRITLTAYGKERALCTEHTEACWAKNRRANFLTKAQ